ncbi:hypothetical protein CC78DRAFT_622512 [Lojkania enalia]|uniref:Uncharacterized protein n=1 Tax=Lojkania enalia TaxID=147567 RepID=A0A9P4N3X5_9PLEO|nr:hypothetical protein CC78DRAFT_622512 [Didymosphaeria enalia]
MSGTSLAGSFKDCGPGNLPQIDFSCTGPACSTLNEFPGGTALGDGSSLKYSSEASCESENTNYLSQFVFSQPPPEIDHYVSQEQNITLPDCKGLHVESDGTSAGTRVDSLTRSSGPGCEPEPPSESSSALPLEPPLESSSVAPPEPQPTEPGSVQSSAEPVEGSSTIVVPLPSPSEPGFVASSEVPLPGSTSIPIGEIPSPTEESGTPPTNIPGPTSSEPAQFTGSGARHHPKTGVLLLLLFILSLLIQDTSAYILNRESIQSIERRDTYALRIRQLTNNLGTFATQLGGYVATKVEEDGGEGETFADGLISDTLSTICLDFFAGGAPEVFSPVVVENCITAIYDDSSAVGPEQEFLAVFGASMFCNYLTSQAYPIANEFSSEACEGLEELIVEPSAPSSSVPEPTVPPVQSSALPLEPPEAPSSIPIPPSSSSALVPPPSIIVPPSSSALVPPPSIIVPPSSSALVLPPSIIVPPSSSALVTPPSIIVPPSSSALVPPSSSIAPLPSSTNQPSTETPLPPPTLEPPSPLPPTTSAPFTNSSITSVTPTSTEFPPECTASTEATCDGECVDLTSDPNNCGECGIVCSSGTCSNGACSSNSCTGQTCSTFTSCGPGGNCVCASIVDNTGFCVDGTTSCGGLASCATSLDCPLGAVCAVGTCCSGNVCIVADTCGGFSNGTDAGLLVRGWTGDTIARKASWDQ